MEVEILGKRGNRKICRRLLKSPSKGGNSDLTEEVDVIGNRPVWTYFIGNVSRTW